MKKDLYRFNWSLFMKNNLIKNSAKIIETKVDWNVIQEAMKNKFGKDIYESWLKKMKFSEEFNNYILITVSTRFIRDWITSRYLDQILQIVKSFKKEIIRIEFLVSENNENTNVYENLESSNDKKISFIKDSALQYNRIDPNKNFENFILGGSNKLAYEASKKICEDLYIYNPLYIYGGVGMGKTHLMNSIGFDLKQKKK